MTYENLLDALRIFGLGSRATLVEIKKRHRYLVKQHHPDTGNAVDDAAIQQVNSAYCILLDYVADYRFSFTEDEFYEQNPEERLRQQFMDTALWGKS